MLARLGRLLAGTTAAFSLLAAGHANVHKAAAHGEAFVCEHPPYDVHLVSSSPLVVYLAGFLTAAEREHLQAATKDSFAHSAVAERGTADGRTIHNVRTSQSTNVPRDAVVRCIEERALRFQGLLVSSSDDDAAATAVAAEDDSRARLEPLQLVNFFAYVRVSQATNATDGEAGPAGPAGPGPLRGGGTNFPVLDMPAGAGADDERWCAYIDCDEPWEHGVTFRPVEGNAVYWDNLLPPAARGTGDPRTLHAGLPVVRGEKIGMNIWTRQAKLPAEVRGPDV
ncbi:Prolyl 4-hydroxylase, alpha subunit [Niveomyces insectorum RCEF 264]|uniref:Prolyl 4-hydroxylase, alpha subunit n=1 Tax=Niveomyces insectorum RCEF 264 TaxID=1081102 RepID=A0A167QDC8_9HYPO|nr:Prolyl 4-hydroxylase, alpha subunit [Niveomyces insectorum RCEF 264]